ncbi:MAG: hypothetical protein P8O70_17170 [SAR324 cluster bacterium]|nr:hypothetical protein [SAR324 cluster bacterium]
MNISKNVRTADQRPSLFQWRSAGQAIDDFREQIRWEETDRNVWETRLSKKGFQGLSSKSLVVGPF